jgi:hypothetical protein
MCHVCNLDVQQISVYEQVLLSDLNFTMLIDAMELTAKF